MARSLDPGVDDAIVAAALALLREVGFARMSIEAVAKRAQVGKPAVYRRFPDKPALVAAVIKQALPQMEAPNLGDTRAELKLAMDQGLPADGSSYVGLIGGLIAEQDRHPELIAAFREHILLPRRALVAQIARRGIERGDIRPGIDPEQVVDLVAGPFLARVFAGLDTGAAWRAQAFDTWWEFLSR